MLTPDYEIKRIIEDNWDYLKDIRYPEDDLVEYAYSEVPIYTSEIIQEWQDLPNDYRDEGWKMLSPETDDLLIVDLMKYDLYHYYQTLFDLAYAEVKEEREDDE